MRYIVGVDGALLNAVCRNDLAGCDRALHLGGDINMMAGPHQMTPLYIACQGGCVDVVLGRLFVY